MVKKHLPILALALAALAACGTVTAKTNWTDEHNKHHYRIQCTDNGHATWKEVTLQAYNETKVGDDC